MEARAMAERAALSLHEDRDAAKAWATEALALATDRVTTAIALRVIAAIQLQERRVASAAATIAQALDVARRAGDQKVLGETLMTQMGVHVLAGRPHDALADAQEAERYLPPELLPRLRVQTATVLATGLDRLDDAIAIYDGVLEHFVGAGSKQDEAVIRNNRGLYLLRRGDVAQAWIDLTLARDLFETLGNADAAAECGWNVMMAAARSGDLPLVFSIVDDLESMADPDDPRAASDLAHALLEANLVEEAVRAATVATALTDRSPGPWAVEARLRLAEALLRAGRNAEALEHARQADATARQEGHGGWAALARTTSFIADRTVSQAPLAYDQVDEALDELHAHGWLDEEADARLALASVALDAGEIHHAIRLAEPVTAPSRRLAGRSRERAMVAAVIVRAASGDHRGALLGATAAMRAMANSTRHVASRELRTAAARRRVTLGALVLRLCWEHGRPRQIFDWAERLRGQELTPENGGASADAVHDDLAELRALELSNADAATKRFVRRHVERRIASTSRRATASVSGPTDGPFHADRLLGTLGDAALLEFCLVDGVYRAIVLHRGRARRSPIAAPVPEIDRHVTALQEALAELVAPPSAASSHHAGRRARAIAADLSRSLVEPCLLPPCPIVLVPTGGLHGLPWNALPGCHGRPVCITPSAALWAHCDGKVARPGTVAVVVGPGLAHGQREADHVAGLYGQATVLAGDLATSSAALDAFGSVDLLHIAAHGTFRSDNPLLSSLDLADGPLMGYDLEPVDRLPGHVVLSACDLGLNRVVPGDELLGFTAALFARGVHTIIAASQIVDDAAACELMIGYHERLRRGDGPAQALAGAASAARASGDSSAAATSEVFGCYGAGWSSA